MSWVRKLLNTCDMVMDRFVSKDSCYSTRSLLQFNSHINDKHEEALWKNGMYLLFISVLPSDEVAKGECLRTPTPLAVAGGHYKSVQAPKWWVSNQVAGNKSRILSTHRYSKQSHRHRDSGQKGWWWGWCCLHHCVEVGQRYPTPEDTWWLQLPSLTKPSLLSCIAVTTATSWGGKKEAIQHAVPWWWKCWCASLKNLIICKVRSPSQGWLIGRGHCMPSSSQLMFPQELICEFTLHGSTLLITLCVHC